MEQKLKRLLDILISFVGLIILFLPIIIISGFIMIKMGKPIFFTQKRAGKHGEAFKIYKFRTMKNTTDENGVLLNNELRRDSFGDFLRKSSLDEIPQLINILKGDLSLVGPRPLLIEYNNLYDHYQKLRLETKPGLTGWAQVNGRNTLTWKQKFEYDIWYVKNWSLILDIKIIMLTIVRVLKSDGVNTDSNRMVKRFTGNEEE